MQNTLSVMAHIKMGPQWHLAHNVIKHIFVIGPLTGSETNAEHVAVIFSSFWLLLLLSKQTTQKKVHLHALICRLFSMPLLSRRQSLGLSQNSIERKGETRLKHRSIVSRASKGKKNILHSIKRISFME